MANKKPDFTKTQLNPFQVGVNAATEILGLPPQMPEKNTILNKVVNETTTDEIMVEPNTQSDVTTAIKDKEEQNKSLAKAVAKKTREAIDKEKGKAHVHLILPQYQADALKRMAKLSGMTVTEFMFETIEMHLNNDWQPVLAQFQQNQKKLGFGKKPLGDKDLFNK